MATRLEDEIKRQLDEGRPIDITENGEVIIPANPDGGSDDPPVNPATGEPVTRLKPQRWFSWYEDNPGRLLLEKHAMNRRFPAFQLLSTNEGLTWTGYLYPTGTQPYRIALTYPSDFPYSPPKIWVLDPVIRSPKHQFPDGSLCLMKSTDGTWQTNTSAVTVLAIASTWIWCYDYHERHCGCFSVPCSKWPGREA